MLFTTCSGPNFALSENWVQGAADILIQDFDMNNGVMETLEQAVPQVDPMERLPQMPQHGTYRQNSVEVRANYSEGTTR